jgi:IS4 transposase
VNKSTFFSGQPILAQLMELIPEAMIARLALKHKSDRYCKTFTTRDHLITMIYGCFHQCTSLREISTGMVGNGKKLDHLAMQNFPCRSTLADANRRRSVDFFKDLYLELYARHFGVSPDSRNKKKLEDRLFILDSTTITLFSDVLRGVGGFNNSGKKKGGVKAHVLLDAKHNVPRLIKLSEGVANDKVFMPDISLNKGDILVFDKGYQNLSQWQEWTNKGINWVTRINDNQHFEVLEQKIISLEDQKLGVCSDQKIRIGRGSNKATKPIIVRMVSFYVPALNRIFHYLTNNFRFNATTIAALYQDRWQIETYFKSLKQSNHLRYFLGDNENAIQIQLWCCFIKDLLVKIIKSKVTRTWAFSNISSMIRHHIMNYIDVVAFLNNPEKFISLMTRKRYKSPQLKLFIT